MIVMRMQELFIIAQQIVELKQLKDLQPNV